MITVLAVGISGMSISVWAKPYTSSHDTAKAIVKSVVDTTQTLILTDKAKVVFAESKQVDTMAINSAKVSLFKFGVDDTIEGCMLDKKNNVQKNEMLATMNASYIRKRLNISQYKDSDEIRKKAKRYKKDEIHSLLYGYLMEKCAVPYKLFLEERSDRTEVDDLIILSNRLNVE